MTAYAIVRMRMDLSTAMKLIALSNSLLIKLLKLDRLKRFLLVKYVAVMDMVILVNIVQNNRLPLNTKH